MPRSAFVARDKEFEILGERLRETVFSSLKGSLAIREVAAGSSNAEELELNVDQFEKDLESDEGKRKIDEDYASGLKFNVNATPTFFLNGKKLENMRSFNDFKREIENLLR